jgi:hypothetical protein
MSNYLNNPILYKNVNNPRGFLNGNKSYSNTYMNYPMIPQTNYVEKTILLNGLGKNNNTPKDVKDLYNLQLLFPTNRGL